MLSRLGLVIHWIGFVVGITAAMSREDLQIAITNAEGGSDIPNLKNWLFILLLGVGPITLAWAIRFILTGNKSPLPWVANKEAT